MKCTFFQNSHCKSCELLDKSYDETIALKSADLASLFPNDLQKFKPVVRLSDGAAASRSKAKFAVFPSDVGVRFGFYSSTGVPKDLEECPLHAKGINELIPVLKDFLQKFKIPAYDLKTKTGEIKYVLISKSESAYLIRFVLRSKEALDRLRMGVAFLQELRPEIQVITANIQPVHQAIIEGDEEILLSKEKVILHQFDEFSLALGARSFFQVTPEIAKALYNALSVEVRKDAPESLLDLYCGVGAFSFYASRGCKNVSGVEISVEAIECAKLSNEMNNKSISFYAMDVETFLDKNKSHSEAVLVNPPRRGLNSSILNNILTINPQYIYYSSCNAQSMKRDFESLSDVYEVRSLQLFDMFPFSHHYETLMCLERKVFHKP
jgi:23S rRNA (uracil747-C5)-methyltransferase